MNSFHHNLFLVPSLPDIYDCLVHQPTFVHVVMAYAVGSLAMFWSTRAKGFLISFCASAAYLVPLFVDPRW